MHHFILLNTVVLFSCSGAQTNQRVDMKPKTALYQKGINRLEKIDGKDGEAVVDALAIRHPELAAFIVEFPFGVVYEQLNLDPQSAEIAVVAMLSAMGTARPQLKVHIAAALHVGATPAEIRQAIYQSAVYAGYPAAINASKAFDEVDKSGSHAGLPPNFTTSTPQDWHALATSKMNLLSGALEANLNEQFSAVGAKTPDAIVYAFGRVTASADLDGRKRQLATVAMLAALGLEPQLKFHISAALKIGIEKGELEDVMYLVSVYAGIPRSINGLNVLIDVLGEDASDTNTTSKPPKQRHQKGDRNDS